MLMLGESIFSLLVVSVPQEDQDFFTVFYLCLLTVVFVQLLHFQSQPHNADTHAMRRHKNAGALWNILQQLLSFSLVLLGSCFTFILEYAGKEERRRLAPSELNFQAVADLFSGSLCIIFVCLSVTNLLHLGKHEVQKRCVVKGKNGWKGVAVFFTHAALIGISATLSRWMNHPRNLSIAGLCLVLLQLSVRKFETVHLSPSRSRLVAGPPGKGPIAVQTDEGTGEAPWPDVTHARAEEPSDLQT
jgi:hypothetical protein